eukprot:2788242-Lingulodinium_polyedra.AAC.1
MPEPVERGLPLERGRARHRASPPMSPAELPLGPDERKREGLEPPPNAETVKDGPRLLSLAGIFDE